MTVSNIAATGYNPPSPFQTLGNLVGVAQGVQALQTGQIQQQRLGLNLQAEQQANEERKAVVAAMQSGDQDLKSGPDGLIDQPSAIAKLQKLAPQTWGQYAGVVNESNSNANAVNGQLLNLGKEKLNELAGAVGSLTAAGVKPSDFAETLVPIGETSKPMKPVIDRLLKQVDAANGNPQKLQMIAQQVATRVRTLSDNFDTYQGKPELVNQGSKLQPTIMQSRFTGEQPGTAVGSPLGVGIAPYAFTNQYGQQAFSGGTAPRLPSTTGATGGGNPSIPNAAPTSNPTKFQAASIGAAQEQTLAALDPKTTGAIQQNLSAVSHLKNIIGSSPDFSFGPGTEFTNKARAVFGGANNVQEAQAYLDRIAANAMAQTGVPQTNAGLAAGQSMTGNVHEFNQESLLEKVRQTEATLKMANDYTKGLATATGYGTKNDWQQKQAFDAKFGTSASPDVWRFETAIKNGDKAELARLIGPNGAYKTADDINDLRAKRKAIQSIIPGF